MRGGKKDLPSTGLVPQLQHQPGLCRRGAGCSDQHSDMVADVTRDGLIPGITTWVSFYFKFIIWVCLINLI